MHQLAPQNLKFKFETTRYKSLIAMLDAWSPTDIIPASLDMLVYPDDVIFSEKDIRAINSKAFLPSPTNQVSVDWAVKNIYSDPAGKVFKPEWKKELQDLAVDFQYRILQLQASFRLHDKALKLMRLFKLKNVNSYLFLFDLVVQTSGINEQNVRDFNAFVVKNPNAMENEKLFAILNSKLIQLNPKWREDARLRKTALINGQGKVHGTLRNFRKEYCY